MSAQEGWPGNEDDLLMATVTITRRLSDEGMLDHVRAVASDGEALPLTEVLGMMRLAEDTLIREAMGDFGDDDEEAEERDE